MVKPVERYSQKKVLVDNIKDKVCLARIGEGDRRLPGSAAAGASDDDSLAFVGGVARGFELHAVGPHIHARHAQVDIRRLGIRRWFVAEADLKQEILHGFYRPGRDGQGNRGSCQALGTGTLVQVAIDHLLIFVAG